MLVVLAGCWRGAAPDPAPYVPPPPPSELAISQVHFGPIDAQSAATLTALRGLFPRYIVKAINDGTLEYDVFDGDERLLFVVPTDDGHVFNVHATSARIGSDHGWRVGKRFRGASRLSQCECWGENPTCWTDGEHVAVNFKRSCDDLSDGEARKVLEGMPIQRVIWSPRPFGE